MIGAAQGAVAPRGFGAPAARLEPGDCLDVMLELAAAGEAFDALISDPPYHLSTVERFGKPGAAPAKHGTDGLYARASAGFMGKAWDGGDVAFRPETWRLAYDVLKPGAHVLAFGGTRTFHRMAVAIEDAGFELRDCVMWLYGTGFPKSHDVSKGIDKAAGAVREVIAERVNRVSFDENGEGGGGFQRGTTQETAPATPEAAAWSGWGTALKPAWEPIIVARKPLAGTVAANVLAHGTGALNIDASRIPLDDGTQIRTFTRNVRPEDGYGMNSTAAQTGVVSHNSAGRWPANVVHDGSAEVLESFARFGESTSSAGKKQTPKKTTNAYGDFAGRDAFVGYQDTGTAARFFYSAKASSADRIGSKHPTVKPLALIRYLCRLVTPPGGVILDPFAGSGTTLQAAVECGFGAVGIEREAEYQADIRRRLDSLTSGMEDMCA